MDNAQDPTEQKGRKPPATTNPESLPVAEIKMQALAAYTRRKAARRRSEAYVLFGLVVLLLFFSMWFLIDDSARLLEKASTTVLEDNGDFLELQKAAFMREYHLSQEEFNSEQNSRLFQNRLKSEAKRFTAVTEEQSRMILIFSLVIRVSVVVTLYFIIRILLGMFKYRLAQADFFDSRTAIFGYVDPTASISIKDLIKLLSTDHFELALPQKTPAEVVADVVKGTAKTGG